MRYQIIQAALSLFLSKGVLQTSLVDIAKTLNITKGGIYHYFGNKEELLFESFRLVTMGMESYLEPLKDDKVTLKDGFNHLLSIMKSQANEEVTGQYEFLLYCSRTYPELKSELIQTTEAFYSIFEDMIHHEIELGFIKETIDYDYVKLKISLIFEGTMFLDQVYASIDMEKYVPKLFEEVLMYLYQ